MEMKHILVVDDDPEIQELLKEYLEEQLFKVTCVSHAVELDQLLPNTHIDLLILDLMLPGEDGYSICRRLSVTHQIPMLMLTAKGDDMSRIIGLEMGADDYMAKPFNPRVLLAKIKALLRRVPQSPNGLPNYLDTNATSQKISQFEEWSLNHSTRELVNNAGQVYLLGAQDFNLLVALLEMPNQELSRDLLYDRTRGQEHSPLARSLDVQVSRLRQKIEKDAKAPQTILTVRGIGYMFCSQVNIRYQPQ